MPLNLQETILPIKRALFHLIVARVSLFTHSLAVLFELLEAYLTFFMHVNHPMFQTLEVNLRGAGVYLLFNLDDLFLDFTEPLVQSFFHLCRIDSTILNDLRTLNQIGPGKGWRCLLL